MVLPPSVVSALTPAAWTSPARAILHCMDVSDLTVELPYNPQSLQLSRRTGVGEVGGGQEGSQSVRQRGAGGGSTVSGSAFPNMRYTGGARDTLSFSTLLDESEDEGSGMQIYTLSLFPNSTDSITSKLRKLYKLTLPLKFTVGSDKQIRPPVVVFVWGDFYFSGMVSSFESTIKLFDSEGRPRRAMVNLSLLGRAFHAPSTSKDALESDFTPAAATASSGGTAPGSLRSQLLSS